LTLTTPPRPPRLSDPVDREELEALVKALIEEARQRARRRRQKYAAFAVVASLVAVGITTILERSTGEEDASLARAARSSVAAGSSGTLAFITARRACSAWGGGCRGPGPPRRALNGKLYVVNADGSGLRLVAQKASIAAAPAWSPDGQRLMFSFNAGGIYVVNVDGGGLQNLTRGGGATWSPDGQKIAFGRVVKVRPEPPGGLEIDSEIYVMNADGSGQQDVTRNEAFAWNADPAWSPDGQQIAFTSNRSGNCASASADRCKDLYVMNADGSRQRQLTGNATVDAFDAWSPDGQKIAFQRRSKGTNWEIHVMNADGSGQRNLTRNRSHDLDAAWSPDGRSIVFRTSRHGKWELYVMNANGSGQQRLTRTAANESRPSWSPDGGKIAFTREVGGNFELYVMNADGSGQRRLTPNSPVDRWVAYAWSPAQK
jgi:Tol biopolymer transport system component